MKSGSESSTVGLWVPVGAAPFGPASPMIQPSPIFARRTFVHRKTGTTPRKTCAGGMLRKPYGSAPT